jgi:hypothetical protein
VTKEVRQSNTKAFISVMARATHLPFLRLLTIFYCEFLPGHNGQEKIRPSNHPAFYVFLFASATIMKHILQIVISCGILYQFVASICGLSVFTEAKNHTNYSAKNILCFKCFKYYYDICKEVIRSE